MLVFITDYQILYHVLVEILAELAELADKYNFFEKGLKHIYM